jgi:exodeoxyribonuclease V alpha subunit
MEVLYVRVTSVPKKLGANRKSPEAWGRFHVLNGPRSGKEYWFTGPVFPACRLLKRGIVACVRGEFLTASQSGMSRDGFFVRDVSDITVAPDGKVLDSLAEITGIQLREEEYATCLAALNATSLQEASAILANSAQARNLAQTVGEDTASRFAGLCSWERKWGADMLAGLFEVCGLGEEIDHALIWQVVKVLRHRAARNGMSVAALVQKYPYVLTQVWDDKGFAMQVAKTIAQHTGTYAAYEEAAAAAINAMQVLMDKGHCFAWENQLSAAMFSTGATEKDVQKAWRLLYSPEGRRLYGGLHSEKDGTNLPLRRIARETRVYPNKQFKIDKNPMPRAVYAPAVYWSERDAAFLLSRVLSSPSRLALDPKALLTAAQKAALQEGRTLDAEQKDFIAQVAQNKITVLIGEAGTGKTQAIRWLIRALNETTPDFAPHVLAPTALAAFRVVSNTLGEAAASTIHRYASFFLENADYFVQMPTGTEMKMPGLVIVDECSMLGPVLLAKLLRSTVETTRIVFAGDPSQLQPVGPAGVFDGLVRLAGGNIPGMGLVELKKNYRADAGSEVYMAAREVRRGNPIPTGLKQIRVVYVKNDDEAVEQCVKTVAGLVGSRWPDVPGEVLVLTPYRTKKSGTERLNAVLAEHFAGKASSLFVPGTPVVARRNDYADSPGTVPRQRWEARHPLRDFDVYNGTLGTVKDVKTAGGQREICVAYVFNGQEHDAWYYEEELPYYVEPAYAMTVHKAQGGEAKHVALVLTGQLAYRSLLYTALSRCKDDPPGTGSVTIITLKRFADAPYALPNWQDEVVKEAEGDEEEAPVPQVLSGFYYRAWNDIWASLPNYVPPVQEDEGWSEAEVF